MMIEKVFAKGTDVFLGWRGTNGTLYRKKVFAETYGER